MPTSRTFPRSVSQNPTPPVSGASKGSLSQDGSDGRSSPVPVSLPTDQEDARRFYELLGSVEDQLEMVLPLMRRHTPPPIVGKIKRRWNRIQDKVSIKRARVDPGQGKGKEKQVVDVSDDENEADGENTSNDVQDENEGEERDEQRGEEGESSENENESGVNGENGVNLQLNGGKGPRNNPQYQAQRLIPYFVKPAGRVTLCFLFEWLGDSNRTRRELDGLKRIISGYCPVDEGDVKMRNYLRKFRANVKDVRGQCEEWIQLDQNRNEEQRLIDLEVNMQAVECQNKGMSVLSGILYRMQCIKISRLLAHQSRGRGGQAWVVKFYKNVFEKKKGFYHYTDQEKRNKWKEDKTVEEYEEEKKSQRWLVQSRNRLLKLYDVVGVTAILDPAFEPSRNNAGSKNFPYIVDIVEQEMRRLDVDEEDSPLERSRVAEAIVRYVGSALAGETVTAYLDEFFARHRPNMYNAQNQGGSQNTEG